ncbi:MAG TPA: macro domain-containing protein, partial [Methylomirabilota bacterium]|nr:macro domain-containing protein [Methylomirabilota bacterium]
LKGQCERIAMAVVGSDLARLGNTVSHSTLIKLVVSSFILTSREKLVTHELVIAIHKSNMDKVNMVDINEFLQNF